MSKRSRNNSSVWTFRRTSTPTTEKLVSVRLTSGKAVTPCWSTVGSGNSGVKRLLQYNLNKLPQDGGVVLSNVVSILQTSVVSVGSMEKHGGTWQTFSMMLSETVHRSFVLFSLAVFLCCRVVSRREHRVTSSTTTWDTLPLLGSNEKNDVIVLFWQN